MTDGDERIDLSALGARSHSGLEDRVVERVLARVRGPTVARPLGSQVAAEMARWRWPALAAAASLALVATVGGLAFDSDPQPDESAPVAAAVGVPESWVQWMASGNLPTSDELMIRYGGR